MPWLASLLRLEQKEAALQPLPGGKQPPLGVKGRLLGPAGHVAALGLLGDKQALVAVEILPDKWTGRKAGLPAADLHCSCKNEFPASAFVSLGIVLLCFVLSGMSRITPN